MTKDIAGFRDVLQSELQTGHNVVVLLHSWSGFVGAAAVKGLGKSTSGVAHIHIIYLASWLPPSNVSSCAWLSVPELASYDVKEGLEHVKNPTTFYSDLPQSVADEAIRDLLPKAVSTSHEPVALDYQSIRSTYSVSWMKLSRVLGNDDRARPDLCEIRGIQSGHSPFLNMPGRVANIVKRVAGEEVDMNGIVVDEKKLL